MSPCISNRRRIYPRLAEMNAIRREAFEFAGVGFYRYRFDGTLIFMDRNMLRCFEIEDRYPDPEMVAGHKIGDLFIYLGPQGLLRETIRKQGSVRGLEYPFKTLKGTLKWARHDSYLVRDARTGEEAIQAIVQDITERKRIEENLRAAENKYRALFDSMMDAYCKVDMAGRMLETNPAYEALLGYTADELRRLTYVELTPEPWRAMEARIVSEQVLVRGYSDVYEKAYQRKDGSVFPVELRTYLLRDDKGQPLGMWAIVRDITARRNAEASLKENQRMLQERNQLLEGLSESAPAGMAFFDAAFPYRVLLHNRVYQSFWDEPFRSCGMVGKPISEYAPQAEESGIFGVFREVARTGKGRTIYDFPYAGLTRGMTWWNWSLTPIYHNTVLSGFGHMLIEVTPQYLARQALKVEIEDRKRLEIQLRRLNETLEQRVRDRTAKLEAANKEMEAFAYSVSHDLRAPLRGIDGFSQALLEDYGDTLDENGREDLRFIRQGAQQMAHLIDDMLRLSRIGRAEMHWEMVDLSVLARAIADSLGQREPERRVDWRIESTLPAWGDQALLRIMLENLLENAWKFTGKRPVARIEVFQADRNGTPVYAIRDNGAGFDMGYAGKLFEPFQRLHRADEFPGSGIGLAIVQRIINRHGGRVWAEAAVDQGATFYFHFPEKTEAQ